MGHQVGRLVVKSLLVLITTLLFTATTSHARPVPRWPYNKLLANSDLVVIANAIGTSEVANTDKPLITLTIPDGGERIFEPLVGKLKPESLILHQVETIFHVQAVLKGTFDKKQLVLVHFRWMNNDEKSVMTRELIMIDGGRRFVEFPAKGAFLDEARKEQAGPDCVLFLRLRKDGKYECVSDQFDPVYSVRWLKRRP